MSVLDALGKGLGQAATAATLIEQVIKLLSYARGDSDARPALLTVLPSSARSMVEFDRQRAIARKRFETP